MHQAARPAARDANSASRVSQPREQQPSDSPLVESFAQSLNSISRFEKPKPPPANEHKVAESSRANHDTAAHAQQPSSKEAQLSQTDSPIETESAHVQSAPDETQPVKPGVGHASSTTQAAEGAVDSRPPSHTSIAAQAIGDSPIAATTSEAPSPAAGSQAAGVTTHEPFAQSATTDTSARAATSANLNTSASGIAQPQAMPNEQPQKHVLTAEVAKPASSKDQRSVPAMSAERSAPTVDSRAINQTFGQMSSAEEHRDASGRSVQPQATTGQSSTAVTQYRSQESIDSAGQMQAQPSPAESTSSAGPRAIDGVRAMIDSAGRSDATPVPAAARAEQVDRAIRVEQAGLSAASSEGPVEKSAPPIGAAARQAAMAHQHAATSATTMFNSSAQSDEADLPASFASQAARGLSALVNQRGGSLTLRLDPPELGAMRVQMTIISGTVSVEFTTATMMARSALDQTMAMLRHSLESQGLTVERLAIQSATPTGSTLQSSLRQDDSQGGTQQNAQHHSQQHDAGGSHSRGRQDRSYEDLARLAWSPSVEELTFESLMGDSVPLAQMTGAVPS